jgi:hypothetical protein
MDKPLPPTTNFPFRREGFALIITLTVLTAVIALTGVLVGYLDMARKETSKTEAVIQANIYFTDIKEILSRFKEKKALYNVLYLTPLPLQLPKSRFSLFLECHPLRNGVNINWLTYANNSLMEAQYNAAQKVFEGLVQQYALEDPALLEEMLYREMHAKSDMVLTEDQSRLMQKNDIMSYRQFQQILTRYQLKADDQNVGQIPWEKYFVFLPVEKEVEANRIAGDYLSVELLSLLFDIDRETLKGEWSEGDGAFKALMKKYGIQYDNKLYATKFMNQSVCDVTYTYNEKRFAFTFVDKEGEVKDFEFFGEQ